MIGFSSSDSDHVHDGSDLGFRKAKGSKVLWRRLAQCCSHRCGEQSPEENHCELLVQKVHEVAVHDAIRLDFDVVLDVVHLSIIQPRRSVKSIRCVGRINTNGAEENALFVVERLGGIWSSEDDAMIWVSIPGSASALTAMC